MPLWLWPWLPARGRAGTSNSAFLPQPFVSGNVLSPVAGDIISLTWDANARSYVQVKVMNAGAAVRAQCRSSCLRPWGRAVGDKMSNHDLTIAERPWHQRSART